MQFISVYHAFFYKPKLKLRYSFITVVRKGYVYTVYHPPDASKGVAMLLCKTAHFHYKLTEIAVAVPMKSANVFSSCHCCEAFLVSLICRAEHHRADLGIHIVRVN